MGNLYFVEQDHIFKLCGIPHNSPFPNQRIPADKCTVAYFRVFPDDRRTIDECRGSNLCGLGDPHILPSFLILFLTERAAQFYDKFTDEGKHFPGIGLAFQKFFCHCLV